MRNEIYVALLAATLVYVFWRGGREERQAAGLLLGAVLLTGLLVTRGSTRFNNPEYGIFVADLIYYLGMLVLAARTQRAFALCISAIIGAQLLLHLARFSAVHVDDWVYSNAVSLWSYPKLIILNVTVLRRSRAPGSVDSFLSIFFRRSAPSSPRHGRIGS